VNHHVSGDAVPAGYREGALGLLRYNWGDAYLIGEADGVWTAQRRDTGHTLTAASAGELREAIVADYATNPVPR